jgi:hypothetical protein
MVKRDLVIVVLCTFCLTATLFETILTNSTIAQRTYDPWIDTNDDGRIDIKDLVIIVKHFGTVGDGINKTALLLDLQNRVGSLEERLNSVKTIRFYTPNETMTDDYSWKDAAIFVWTPQNATNNAIIQGATYFQYLTPDSAYYQIVFRILINDFEVQLHSVSNYTIEYQQTILYGFGSWTADMVKPNQSTYTIKFQIKCVIKYPGPSYIKDINILLQVMDGLPPS